MTKQLERLRVVEKERKLHIVDTLRLNNGLLRTELYGFIKNFDLTKGTMLSWVLSMVFLAIGIPNLLFFGTNALLVWFLLVQALVIWITFKSLNEYKKWKHSIRNVNRAIDDGLIDFSTEATYINDVAVQTSTMSSKDETVADSLGTIAKYITLFNSNYLLGAVLLKHKNHTPFIMIFSVACLLLFLAAKNVFVLCASITLLISLVSCF